ncbi:MAG TPA: polyamine aminopropyltransferase [Candidatus Tenderia sp.]|nr:polyamine aminopropyltransferase [Candidatus Tenderia sp.]
MALDEKEWFTEVHSGAGSAFSLKIKARLHQEQTPFQTIAIYDTEQWGKLMTIDGFVMLTSRDNFLYHEMMTHPALYTHADPRRVVIIGGGDCGTLREVLKHDDVEQVWQVDIDERVTRLAEHYFPELCQDNDDLRANLLWDDGLRFIKEAEKSSIDLIIVDSTDPIGPAEGLFNQAFYEDCLVALRGGGLLVQQSEAPMYHLDLLKSMHHHMRAAGFVDTKTLHFPQPVYPSGWWSATLACKDNPIEGFREVDARAKSFSTRYYNVDIHKAALVQPEFCKAAGLG